MRARGVRTALAALGALALGAGCGPLLGIDDQFSSPDAAPTAPPTGVSSHIGVAGHGSTTYHTELTTVTIPDDLTQVAIEAYVLDDTGFHRYAGIGHADGTFAIPDVPARDYHLRLIPKAGGPPAIWHLVGHDVDLSHDTVGRPELADLLARSSLVSLTTPAMRRFLSSDDVRIYASTRGPEASPFWVASAPSVGVDRLASAIFDWAGHPALDDTGVWIVHRGDTQIANGQLDIATALEAAHLTDLHQVSGELLPLSFGFAPGTAAHTTLSIDAAALRDQAGLEGATLEISATPDGGTGTFAGPNVLLATERIDARALVGLHVVSYTDPFPATWSRAALLRYTNQTRALLRLPSYAVLGDRIQAWQVAAPGAELVVPALTVRPPAATGVSLDGVALRDAVHAPAAALHLAWDAVPSATRYTVVFTVLPGSPAIEGFSATTAVPELVVPAGTFPDQARLAISITVATGDPLEPAVRRTPRREVENQHLVGLVLMSSTCGNGVVDPGEDCDTLGESATCNFDCTTARCGDGITNAAAHEDCDTGIGAGPLCDAACHVSVCGDGTLATAAREECDDGNTRNGDGCSAQCFVETLTHCGNGVIDPGEACDDGNTDDLDDCSNACKDAACGDGLASIRGGEECDDGNTITGDGCTFNCRTERCGDGVLIYPEACDDGNVLPGDGCSPDCRLE